MRQGYKSYWKAESRKQNLKLEITRRTPTYQKLFDETFTAYLQATYGEGADIPSLKSNAKVRARFLDESYEAKMLANDLGLPALVDADVSVKMPEIAFYKGTIKIIPPQTDVRPPEESPRGTLRPLTPDDNSPEDNEYEPRENPKLIDALRDGRYLTIEIDLQNPQEKIRNSMDFLVFDVLWQTANQERIKPLRSKALDFEDLLLYDWKMGNKAILKFMRQSNPKTRSKNPNDDREARNIYRRLLSRFHAVKKIITAEDTRLKQLTEISPHK